MRPPRRDAAGSAQHARIRRRGRRAARHHLAGRAHLRAARGRACEAVAREDRLLRPRARRLRALRQIELGERLAEQEPARVLDERHAGRLRDERHRARRARVRLEHVELVAGERELEVEQAAGAERRARSPVAASRISCLGALASRSAPGTTTAESPEWLPARSTCSRIAATHASSPSQSTSTSSSIAFSR